MYLVMDKEHKVTIHCNDLSYDKIYYTVPITNRYYNVNKTGGLPGKLTITIGAYVMISKKNSTIFSGIHTPIDKGNFHNNIYQVDAEF